MKKTKILKIQTMNEKDKTGVSEDLEQALLVMI